MSTTGSSVARHGDRSPRARASLKKGLRVLVAGKLVQRSWQDNDGSKRTTVEIQVTYVGPDLQFATAEVAKSTAGGLGLASEGPSAASSAEEMESH